jgi:hypothetical protein
MTMRIPWRDVVVLGPDAETPLGVADVVSALREYRESGCINRRFLGRIGSPTEDPDDAATWGPEVREIDWTGFPESGPERSYDPTLRCAECRYTGEERPHGAYCPGCGSPVCEGDGDSGTPGPDGRRLVLCATDHGHLIGPDPSSQSEEGP